MLDGLWVVATLGCPVPVGLAGQPVGQLVGLDGQPVATNFLHCVA